MKAIAKPRVNSFDISVEVFDEWLRTGKARVIDVREFGEEPIAFEFEHEQIPLSQLTEKFSMNGQDTVLFFCQSGARSARAARRITDLYGNEKKVYSLRGGLLNYRKQHG